MNEVKELRKKLGLTQEAFAARLGVSVQTVRRWEYGITKPSRLARRLLETIRKERE